MSEPERPEHGDALPEAKVVKDGLKVETKPDDLKPEAKIDGKAEVEIELEASRQRSASWAIGGGVIGALLIWKLGAVAMWGGFVLVAIAVFHAWNLIQSFLNPPGTIIVTDRDVTLPRGLSMSKPLKVSRSDVTAAYFLRRSVPWNHAAPVLVVELGDRALAYPRDWFVSEADQRRIIHALLASRSDAPQR